MTVAEDRKFRRALAEDQDLALWWHRFEFLEWLIDDDPRNLEDNEPVEVDEEVLARDRTTMAALVAPWLARSLLARVGCYSNGRVRTNSRLPQLLRARAETVLARVPHECDSAFGGCLGCYTASRHAAEAAELWEWAGKADAAVRGGLAVTLSGLVVSPV